MLGSFLSIVVLVIDLKKERIEKVTSALGNLTYHSFTAKAKFLCDAFVVLVCFLHIGEVVKANMQYIPSHLIVVIFNLSALLIFLHFVSFRYLIGGSLSSRSMAKW